MCRTLALVTSAHTNSTSLAFAPTPSTYSHSMNQLELNEPLSSDQAASSPEVNSDSVESSHDTSAVKLSKRNRRPLERVSSSKMSKQNHVPLDKSTISPLLSTPSSRHSDFVRNIEPVQSENLSSPTSSNPLKPVDLLPLDFTMDEASAIKPLSASSLFRRRLFKRNTQSAQTPISNSTTARPESNVITSVKRNSPSCCAEQGPIGPLLSSVNVQASDSPSESLSTKHPPDPWVEAFANSSAEAPVGTCTKDPLHTPSLPSPGNFKKLLRDRYLSSQGRVDGTYSFRSAASSESAGNIPSIDQQARAQQLLAAFEAIKSLKNSDQSIDPSVFLQQLQDNHGTLVPSTVPYRREHSVPWNAALSQTLPNFHRLNSCLDDGPLKFPELVQSAFLRSPSSWPLIPQAAPMDTSTDQSSFMPSVNTTPPTEHFHGGPGSPAYHLSNLPSFKPLSNFSLPFAPKFNGLHSQSAPISPQQQQQSLGFPSHDRTSLRATEVVQPSLTSSQRSLGSLESSIQSATSSVNKLFQQFVFSPLPTEANTTAPFHSSATDNAFSPWTSVHMLSPVLGQPFLSAARAKSKLLEAFVFPPPSPVPSAGGGKLKQTDTPLSSLSWISSLSTGSLANDSTAGSPFHVEDTKDQSAVLIELINNLTRAQSLQSPVCVPNSCDGRPRLTSTPLNQRPGSNKRRKSHVNTPPTTTSSGKYAVPGNASTRSSHRTRGSTNTGPHICPVCGRQFNRSDMLARHLHVHTGSRPFECRECGQAFSRSDHLSTHQRTHTGHRPYRCSLCSYSACRRDMITRHLRVHQRRSQRERAEFLIQPSVVTVTSCSTAITESNIITFSKPGGVGAISSAGQSGVLKTQVDCGAETN